MGHQGECKERREVTIKKTEAEKNKGFAFFGLVFKMELLDMGCGTFPRILKVKENSPASRLQNIPEMNEVVTRINGDTVCDFTVADLKNVLKKMKEKVTLQLCTKTKNKTESKICKVCPKPEFPGCKIARVDRPFTPWGMKLKVRKSKPFFEVSSVMDNSPSAASGVKRGDLLLKIDEEDVTTVTEKDVIFATVLNAGKQMQMEVQRRGQTKIFNIERNLSAFGDGLVDGLQISNQPMLCAGFPTVTKIEQHTQAQKLGFAENDVIFSINGMGFGNQEIHEAGMDFSDKVSLNIQICKLDKMSKALKYKMCHNYCPAASSDNENPAASSDNENSTSLGHSKERENVGNDGYVITQVITLNGFTMAQVEAIVPRIRESMATKLAVEKRSVTVVLNETEIVE